MQILIHFIGALLIAYVLSRLTLRIRLASGPWRSLLASHALALGVGLAGLAAVKGPLHGFGGVQLAQMLAAQTACLLIDAIRRNTPARPEV